MAEYFLMDQTAGKPPGTIHVFSEMDHGCFSDLTRAVAFLLQASYWRGAEGPTSTGLVRSCQTR